MRINSIEGHIIDVISQSNLGISGLLPEDTFNGREDYANAIKSLERKGLIQVVPHPFYSNTSNVLRLKDTTYPDNIMSYIRLKDIIENFSPNQRCYFTEKFLSNHSVEIVVTEKAYA